MSTDEEGAVKIAVRERPFIRDIPGNGPSIVHYPSSNKNIIIVNERPYEFDYCLGPGVNQKQLYNELVKPLVEKTLQGYFCTALAYGQTGTGKTFTMGLHSEYFSGDYVGVIPRALVDVFELANSDESSLEIAVSFVEIYNEKVYDLLAEDTNEQVNIKGFKFGGGSKKIIANAQEGYAALTQGNKCRHIRPTKMNPESSRSHAIFTIHVCRKTLYRQTNSLLHLVDLAGSEGVRRTGHQGIALTEGICINQGLLSIGKVLQALANKRKVIPYRDSVLSSVLQDSLKSNSYLTLLACISPFQEDLSETVSTLRFAAEAKSLKHTPEINSILLEYKRNKSKTPHKSFHMGQSKTPTILKNIFNNTKNRTLSTIKKPYHSNTFCTPNKNKKNDRRPLNQTDIGLTPKEKMKFNGLVSQLNPIRCNLQLDNHQKTDYNESISSRSSIMSMNVSTSTLVDAPAVSNIKNFNSFSPLVRQYETLDKKFEKMIEVMKEITSSNKENIMKSSETIKTTNNESIANGFTWSTIKNELQNIVREEIVHMTNSTSLACNKTHVAPDYKSIPEQSLLQTISFAQSSPVSLLPETRKRLSFNATQLMSSETIKTSTILMEQTGDTIFFQSSRIGDTMMANETVVPANRQISRQLSNVEDTEKPARRSMRIERRNSIRNDKPVRRSMRIERRNSMRNDEPVRRSMRIERRNSLKPAHEDASFQEVQASRRRSLQQERRESARRSMHVDRRKTMMPIKEDMENEEVPCKVLGRKVPIYNETIAEYFKPHSDINKPKTKKQIKDAYTRHEKAILDLLNTGSIRELQILPQVGLKTAYQLITQRTLAGKFKNFDQVSKLPMWRGKAWERFKVANNIS